MTYDTGQVDRQGAMPHESWPRRMLATAAEWFALLTRPPRVLRLTHVPWRTSPRLWWSVVALVLIVLATMVTVDVWAVTRARGLPRGLIETFSVITDYGKSGWFLWPLGVLILISWLMPLPNLRRFSQAFFTVVVVRLSFLFFAIALPGLFSATVKQIIGRARPFVADNAADAFLYKPLSWGAAYASLPSGHSTTAFATLVAFGAMWPVLRPLLWIYALMIALSRVIVTAHHPSDVFAGAIVGTIGALLVRDWFAARRLAFTVSGDGQVRPMPGPSVWRVGRLCRDLIAGYRTFRMAAKA